jgi:hypothetical protein
MGAIYEASAALVGALIGIPTGLASGAFERLRGALRRA